MSDNHEHPEHPSGYEKTDTNILRITVVTVISVLVIVISVVILYDYFIRVKEEIIYEQELKPESPELLELRAAEADSLNNYILLDSAKGQYQIPIDEAMELVVKETSGTGGN